MPKGNSTSPYGLVVDHRGHVFVVDSGNMRVQHFMPAEDAEEFLQEEAENGGGSSGKRSAITV